MDLRTSVWLVVVLVNSYTFVNAEKLRLCVVESLHTAIRIRSICPKLVTSASPIMCVTDIDRFSCLHRLIVGEADLAILEPEDLVAAAAYNEYNVLITNELRLFLNEKQSFEMVALVNKNIKHTWNVKGKRFCHPGFDTVNDWTKAFSMYFENRIIPRECDSDKTLLENSLHALSNHFEMACVAGPWSSDAMLDGRLKSKYKNLCAACDNPVGCYSSDKYYGREGALLCLTDNVGDIAWVRLDDTLVHFKNEKIDKHDYNYLCPDGATRPVDFDKPCVWISKPWPVIVARSEIAEKVAGTMNSLNDAKFGWETSVMQLLEGYYISPVSTENLETPEDFLRRFSGFMSANNRASCNPSRRVRWCVASNLENRKCQWLREASIVYGIEPPISCIQEANRTSCLEALENRRVDIFVARPDELLQAREKNLKSIVRAMSNKRRELNRIAAVVKYDSKYEILKDLKGAKACFTGYKSVDWNAFAWLARNISGEDCSDAETIGKFFKDSCVLGLKDESERELPPNLYSLCKKGKKTQTGNDVDALDCLTSGLADVAFVNLKVVERKTGDFDREHGVSGNKKYRILCPNETTTTEKGDSCLLAWTALASIIVHQNMTDVRRDEIYTMLLEMDNLFGITYKGQTPAFSLYGVYDGKHGVIFPEETRHLELHDHRIQKAQSYDDIVEDIFQQEFCSAANKWNPCLAGILFLNSITVLSLLLNL